jgi:hypothetical protein
MDGTAYRAVNYDLPLAAAHASTAEINQLATAHQEQ